MTTAKRITSIIDAQLESTFNLPDAQLESFILVNGVHTDAIVFFEADRVEFRTTSDEALNPELYAHHLT